MTDRLASEDDDGEVTRREAGKAAHQVGRALDLRFAAEPPDAVLVEASRDALARVASVPPGEGAAPP